MYCCSISRRRAWKRNPWGGVDYDKYQHRISKLMQIDGHYYAMKISPAGDKITLDSAAVATGNITNPNDGYTATIYGEQGVFTISGDKDQPVPVPVGRWKLSSYKIDRTKIEEAERRQKAGTARTQSIFSALGKSLAEVGGGGILARRHDTYVEAEATPAYKEIEVRKGETVLLPFGPPYKPQVEVGYADPKDKSVRLYLSLVGSAGEVCSDMELKGDRPPKPEFTITDPQGQEVAKGAFEYG